MGKWAIRFTLSLYVYFNAKVIIIISCNFDLKKTTIWQEVLSKLVNIKECTDEENHFH